MQQTSTKLLRVVVSFSCTSLVVASAGFGAVFAANVSAHGGMLLAGLAVLMAVALEVIKPIAISAAFQSLGSWSLGRGLALLFLGLIAVAYSLTSELSLMSASRGDLSAERAQAQASQTIAKETYERARQELAGLKASRTVGEIEALIAKQSRQGCGGGANVSGKWICPVPTTLLSELSRAKRRSELEAVLQTNAAQVTNGPAIASADPGSVNLSTYLSALGLNVKPEAVAQWLALIPVLALEAGSTLAALLVQAVGGSRTTLSHAQKLPTPHADASERDRVASQIIDHLRSTGGALRGSQRKLAAKIGADRTTLSRAIHSLAASGLVATVASKSGTVLRLAA